jgi:hypothetical protein
MITALEGMRGQRHSPATLHPGKDPVPTVQEAGWDPGPVWTGAKNLAATGIGSQDRPARSELLYRLSYRGPCFASHHNTTAKLMVATLLQEPQFTLKIQYIPVGI